MPAPTTNKIDALQNTITSGMQPPGAVFAINEAVVPHKFPIDQGSQYWKVFTCQLLGMGFVEGDILDDEEPSFVTFGSRGAEGKIGRYGDSTVDSVDEMTKKLYDPAVFALQCRVGKRTPRVEVRSTALDGGIRDPWKSYLEKLVADGAQYLDAATVFVPGGKLAGTAITGAIDALKKTLNSYFGSPDLIGGDEDVIRIQPTDWMREPEMLVWTGWKWLAFTNKDDWWLTLWELTLYGDPADIFEHLPQAGDRDSAFGWSEREKLTYEMEHQDGHGTVPKPGH